LQGESPLLEILCKVFIADGLVLDLPGIVLTLQSFFSKVFFLNELSPGGYPGLGLFSIYIFIIAG
jgi:hypothetical protein